MEDGDDKGELEDSPAIKALGSLFKLTQVHFWVDVSTGMPYGSTSMEFNETEKDDAICLSHTDSISLPVDTELSRQMNELGLPLSFCTNKEKRNGKVRGKRKDTRKKVLHNHEETTNEVMDLIKVNECEPVCLVIAHNNSSSSSQSISLLCHNDLQIEATLDHLDSGTSTHIHVVDDNGMNQKNGSSEASVANRRPEVEESDVVSHSQFPTDCDAVHSGINDEFVDWITYWDQFYGRNYYYNSRTHESTWELPPGMEPLVFVCVENESKEVVVNSLKMDDDADVTKPNSRGSDSGVLQLGFTLSDELSSEVTSMRLHDECNAGLEISVDSFDNSISSSVSFCEVDQEENRLEITLCDELSTSKEHDGSVYCAPETLDTELEAIPKKRKKKVKRARAHRRSSVDNKEVEAEVLMEEFSPTISKYWCQRYILFSKYDEGIKMDKEGWFSVTPEPIAKHHAFRCASGIIVDCFTGVGGNAIQFASKSTHVIAIDIDPKKIEYAQHNAAIYGVGDLIEFISGDSFILARKLKADTVFLSPPWGGPEYAKARNFDINTMLKPLDGQFLFNVAKEMAPRIMMFLPRNVNINQLAELSLSANPPWPLEVEKNFVNGKLKAITAYFTDPLVCKTNCSS